MATYKDLMLAGSTSPDLLPSRRSERRIGKDITHYQERNARLSVRDEADHAAHRDRVALIAGTADFDATLLGLLGDKVRDRVGGDEYQARLQAPVLNDAVEAIRSDFRRTIGLP